MKTNNVRAIAKITQMTKLFKEVVEEMPITGIMEKRDKDGLEIHLSIETLTATFEDDEIFLSDWDCEDSKYTLKAEAEIGDTTFFAIGTDETFGEYIPDLVKEFRNGGCK